MWDDARLMYSIFDTITHNMDTMTGKARVNYKSSTRLGSEGRLLDDPSEAGTNMSPMYGWKIAATFRHRSRRLASSSGVV